jgi:septum site-determining protein MinC
VDEIDERKSLKVVNKTLRSGQRIEHDGDVLIIGDVNPDAYVIASGNIIVMGTLRGIAHAGARGDETAVVMALKVKTPATANRKLLYEISR